MKIIHVDTNKYALQAMREEQPRIVPEAELHSFNDPDQALEFAGAEGCDVLLTEIELWTERLGGILISLEDAMGSAQLGSAFFSEVLGFLY